MANKLRPYEQFGPFILFKRLESDALGELWRAARLEPSAIGSTVALRRLSGGNRAAFTQSASTAAAILPLLPASTMVKGQTVGLVAGVPYLSWDYLGGRSLAHIMAKARGNGGSPRPLPTDQAVAIAERLATSLENTASIKQGNARLQHGALIPQFVWITDDGDVRVAGQGLTRAFSISFDLPDFSGQFIQYFAPEVHQSGISTKESEVFSVGALLYLMLTGEEPPVDRRSEVLARAQLMAGGTPLPADLREILGRSLHHDPASRYPSINEMRSALSKLVHGGQYSPTTFNLAFFLSNLLKKEIESEAVEHEREAKVPFSLYQETAAPSSTPDRMTPLREPEIVDSAPQRSRTPLLAAAIGILVICLGLGWFAWSRSRTVPPEPAPARVSPAITDTLPPPVQPIVAEAPSTGTAAVALVPSEKESKRAFEDAVNRQLQQEMMKLQAEANRKLEATKEAPRERNERPTEPPPPQRAAALPVEENAPSAASLDQSRFQQPPAKVETAPASQPPATVTTPVPPPSTQPDVQPARATTREGDLVDILAVDQAPRRVSEVRPVYPAMALRQKASATIILSALISETGRVLDVRILRGDKRGLGLNESAVRAVRQAEFTPAVKDGKRVRTWTPIPVTFESAK